MPGYIMQLVISLAFRLGVPWIVKHFPGIPTEVLTVIEELIEGLTQQKVQKKELLQNAKDKVAACFGDSCELKKKE